MHESTPDDPAKPPAGKPSKVTPRVKDYLGDMSPHQRGMEKQQIALNWVHEWGVTTDHILCQVVDQLARGYAQTLTKRGLLVRTPTESAGYERGVPRYFYTLSKTGLAEAERHVLAPMQYPEINVRKVSQKLLHHNFVAQQITCDVSDRLVGKKFFSDRRLATRMAGKLKRPDAVLFFKDAKLAIEVELTGKFERDLDQFIFGIDQTLNEEDESIRVDFFYIFSDSKALLERYKKAMEPGMPLPLWEKDQFGKWVSRRHMNVPEYLCKKVSFWYLDDWRAKYGS